MAILYMTSVVFQTSGVNLFYVTNGARTAGYLYAKMPQSTYEK